LVEFKVVVSDPEVRNGNVVVVKVVGTDSLKYTQDEKSGKSLPTALINPKTLERIKTPYNVVTLRIWRDRSKNDKVKFTLRVKPSAEVPEEVIQVPRDMLVEKLGKDEALGEVFRAKAFQITVDGDRARRFVGLKIGDTIDASIIGIPGKLLRITGGSDNSGFPMMPTIPGVVKKAVILSAPPGFHPRNEGERRRKYVRGNTIGEDIVQVNTVLVSPT